MKTVYFKVLTSIRQSNVSAFGGIFEYKENRLF